MKKWNVTLLDPQDNIWGKEIEADELQVVDGCLVFKKKGFFSQRIIKAYAAGCWAVLREVSDA